MLALFEQSMRPHHSGHVRQTAYHRAEADQEEVPLDPVIPEVLENIIRALITMFFLPRTSKITP